MSKVFEQDHPLVQLGDALLLFLVVEEVHLLQDVSGLPWAGLVLVGGGHLFLVEISLHLVGLEVVVVLATSMSCEKGRVFWRV